MSIPSPPKILVIMGSVRLGRRCPQIAAWVRGLADEQGRFSTELIDLRDWKLPPDDEGGIPAKGHYANPHTLAWSAKVADAAGFIIVSPQYNWGYPAALKNALDHLYREWTGKPLMIVTYGGHGGGKCAEQLRQVAEALKLQAVATMPAIVVSREAIEGETPQTADELSRFRPAVLTAIGEMAAMFAGGPERVDLPLIPAV